MVFNGHDLSAYLFLSGFLIIETTADFSFSGSIRLINGVACYS